MDGKKQQKQNQKNENLTALDFSVLYHLLCAMLSLLQPCIHWNAQFL